MICVAFLTFCCRHNFAVHKTVTNNGLSVPLHSAGQVRFFITYRISAMHFTHVKQLSDGFLFDPRSCQAFEYARSPDACMPVLMPLPQVRPRCGCSPQHARPRGGRGARGNGTRAQERTGCLSGLRRGQHGRRCVRPAPRFKISAFVICSHAMSTLHHPCASCV